MIIKCELLNKDYEALFYDGFAFNLTNNEIQWINDHIGHRYYRGDKDQPSFGWSIDNNALYIMQNGVELHVQPDMWLVLSLQDGMYHLVNDKLFRREYMRSETLDTKIHNGAMGLNLMLSKQKEVEQAWNRLPDPTDDAAVSQYIREVILCATDELHEVLAEVNWKPWKSAVGIKDMTNYREELADVMHFILDLYLAAGLTGEDIIQDYMAKHGVNMERTTNTEYKEK